MCGICGFYDLNGANRIELSVLKEMMESLNHRGPDDSGEYIDNDLAFGFTRLSIIDLISGHQPFINEDKSVVLICNGEIFNHQELRRMLEAKGHRFNTNCDVEVVLHLYEEYGTEFLNFLNGQFAFAIYDNKQKRIMCARDHVGIAPLYYTVSNGTFIFASEIKAILRHPYVKRNVDLVSLDQLMNFPGIATPRTLFENIKGIQPGHFLIIDAKHGVVDTEYWDLMYPKESEEEKELEESYYIERLDELLTKAVKIRLNADVPVGFYLSGGLDSSLIAGYIHKAIGCKGMNSYSVDFDNQVLSEGKYQRLMAENVNSLHHEIRFNIDEISKRIKKAIYHSETALKESYNTASLALSEAAHNDNIKVILTGEGADELFGGYIGYRFDQFKTHDKKTLSNDAISENRIRKQLWGNDDFLYEKNYGEYSNQLRKLYSKEVNSSYNEFCCFNHPIVNKERLENVNIFNMRSYVDFKLRMGDHLLTDHGDRMALANSVEARYPFLDREIIEFAVKMPYNMKVRNFKEKYVLKKVAEGIIPKSIIDRPKFAFVAPGSVDLIKSGNEYFQDLLSYDRIKRQGFFNPDEVERLKKLYMSEGFRLNVPYDNDMLIIVLTFNIFLEQFEIS